MMMILLRKAEVTTTNQPTTTHNTHTHTLSAPPLDFLFFPLNAKILTILTFRNQKRTQQQPTNMMMLRSVIELLVLLPRFSLAFRSSLSCSL